MKTCRIADYFVNWKQLALTGKYPLVRWPLLLMIPTLLLACSPLTTAPTYSDIGPVMTAGEAAAVYARGEASPRYGWLREHVFHLCNYCHPKKRANFLSYETTMAVVVPGNPEASLIYQKVYTGEMPKGAVRLSDRKIQAIYDWIRLGAKND